MNWNNFLFALNIVIKYRQYCTVKTCADDDVDLDDISCKYWV